VWGVGEATLARAIDFPVATYLQASLSLAFSLSLSLISLSLCSPSLLSLSLFLSLLSLSLLSLSRSLALSLITGRLPHRHLPPGDSLPLSLSLVLQKYFGLHGVGSMM